MTTERNPILENKAKEKKVNKTEWTWPRSLEEGKTTG